MLRMMILLLVPNTTPGYTYEVNSIFIKSCYYLVDNA